MHRYIIKRLLMMIPVIIGLISCVFYHGSGTRRCGRSYGTGGCDY